MPVSYILFSLKVALKTLKTEELCLFVCSARLHCLVDACCALCITASVVSRVNWPGIYANIVLMAAAVKLYYSLTRHFQHHRRCLVFNTNKPLFAGVVVSLLFLKHAQIALR